MMDLRQALGVVVGNRLETLDELKERGGVSETLKRVHCRAHDFLNDHTESL